MHSVRVERVRDICFESSRELMLTITTEYISQLEGEVAMKAQEANEYRLENRSLVEENGRCRRLIEVLLRHPAYAPFIEDISKDPSIAGSLAQAQQSQTASASVPSQRQERDTPLDMSMLNLNNAGINFQ